MAGTTIPAGWLVCNGAAIDRIDFSSLFAAIGTTWGVGDNLATFNIPDLRGRTVVGVGKGGEGNNAHPSVTSAESAQAKATQHDLGDYDGSETFSHTFTHVAPSFTSRHSARNYCILSNGNADNSWCRPAFSTANNEYAKTRTGEWKPGSTTLALDSENSAAKRNMMPYAALNYIIKT